MSDRDLCTGNPSINAAWTDFKAQEVAAGYPITLLPFWTGLDAQRAVTDNPVVDGIGSWCVWDSPRGRRGEGCWLTWVLCSSGLLGRILNLFSVLIVPL